MKPFFSLSVLLLSAVLMLTACAGSGEIRAIPLTPLPSATPLPTSTPLPTATPVPRPTEAATLPAERVESCLVGRWIVSDASPYFQTAFQGTDIVLGGTSGNAWYNFGEAGIFLLEAIQFAQSAAVKTDVGEVPVDVVMDGIALARYRVEGDKVFFREQSVTSLVFQVKHLAKRWTWIRWDCWEMPRREKPLSCLSVSAPTGFCSPRRWTIMASFPWCWSAIREVVRQEVFIP